MRSSLLSFCVISGFFTMYILVRSANGQWFDDPSLTYQNITFDMANRGSYNTSDCLFDLLQCWEVIKPDMICFWYYHYASYCSIMRELCAESYGDLDSYTQKLNIVQSVCYKNWQQKWT